MGLVYQRCRFIIHHLFHEAVAVHHGTSLRTVRIQDNGRESVCDNRLLQQFAHNDDCFLSARYTIIMCRWYAMIMYDIEALTFSQFLFMFLYSFFISSSFSTLSSFFSFIFLSFFPFLNLDFFSFYPFNVLSLFVLFSNYYQFYSLCALYFNVINQNFIF